jgi:hypothetical protein
MTLHPFIHSLNFIYTSTPTYPIYCGKIFFHHGKIFYDIIKYFVQCQGIYQEYSIDVDEIFQTYIENILFAHKLTFTHCWFDFNGYY